MFDLVVCCTLLLAVDYCCWLCSRLLVFAIGVDWRYCCMIVVDCCCCCCAAVLILRGVLMVVIVTRCCVRVVVCLGVVVRC